MFFLNKSTKKNDGEILNKSYASIVIQFLSVWILFSTLLFLTIFATNLNWARPTIEQKLSESLNRKVKLGMISWTFGLNGLAITTNKISLRESNDNPFIISKQSRIGIAIIPLFRKKLIIRYIALTNPEIWIKRLNDGTWNFADWLKPGPDIRFIEINKGQVHLLDYSNLANKFAPYDFNDIKMKLTWPRLHHKWPFYLACKMPRPGYTSELKLTLIGEDTFEKWQDGKFKFTFSGENLNPQDFCLLNKEFAHLNGRYQLNVSGKNILGKGIETKVSGQVSQMLLPTAFFGAFSANQADFESNMTLGPNEITWQRFLLSFDNLMLESNGSYSWYQMASSPKFNKSCKFAINIDETNKKMRIVKPIAHFLSWFEEFLETQFNKDKKNKEHLMEISGNWNGTKETTDIKFTNFPIDLKTASSVMYNHPLDQKLNFLPFLNELSPSELSGEGQVKLTGHDFIKDGKHSLKMAAKFEDVGMQIKSKNFAAYHINGSLDYDKDILDFHQIQGKIGTGDFELNGKTASNNSIQLNCKNLNIDELSFPLELLDINLPVLANHEVYGQVKELELKLDYTNKKSAISLKAIPDNLYYKPTGLTKPLNATAGTIDYSSDLLSLRDLVITINNSQIIGDIDIDKLSSNSILKRLKLKTYGVGLADISYYLSSPMMPAALHQTYVDCTNKYNLSNLHGKMFGNLLWQAKPNNNSAIDCILGLSSTSFSIGQQNIPVDHVSGTLAISGPELILQDINGSIGNSDFALNGHINNYNLNNPSWHAVLKAQVNPQNLWHLVPDLENKLQTKITTSAAFPVKITLQGNQSSNTITFFLRSNANNHLFLSCPIGTFNQPDNQQLVTDGSISYSSEANKAVKINNIHLAIGNSILQLNGKLNYPDENKPPNMEAEFSSLNSIQAPVLVSFLGLQNQFKGIAGVLSGKVSVKGNSNKFTILGNLSFEHFGLPSLHLSDLTGKIGTSGLSFSHPGFTLGSLSTDANQSADIELDSFKVGALVFENAKAQLSFVSKDKNTGAQKINLQNGSASLAGGLFKISGSANLTNHTFDIQSNLSSMQASQVAYQLWDRPEEISGQGDANLILKSVGTNNDELLANLEGAGFFILKNGKIARFGPFQEKLTHANFLQSGILGFNLNNLLQSMVPVRTGKFKDLKASFVINHGIVNLKELDFNGDDMQLTANGLINLPSKACKIGTKGDIPQVSTSLIGGTLGELSRGISIPKIVSVLTMHKLENLPTLPLIGNITNDRPRAFTFHIDAPYDNGNAIVQSIQKSFHWTPTKSPFGSSVLHHTHIAQPSPAPTSSN